VYTQGLLQAKQQQRRIFQQLNELHQEGDRTRPINHPVIVAQGEVHHRADDYLTVYGNRSLNDVVHTQDGALRAVDDRGAEHGAEDATIGDRERTALHFFNAELVVARTAGEVLQVLLDIGEVTAFDVVDRGDYEAGGGGNGEADVDVVVVCGRSRRAFP